MDKLNIEGFVELVKSASDRYNVKVNERPGVYVLTHVDSGYSYVGSTINLGDRIGSHRCNLKNGCHENYQLQDAFNVDEKFSIHVKVTEDRDSAYDLEQKIIDQVVGTGMLLNLGTADVRSPQKGIKRRPETIAKCVAANTGYIASEEARRKISAANKGRPKPPGFAEHLSEVNRNHPRREELNRNLSVTRMSGDNPNAKAVMVDGVRYESGSEAARMLGVPRSSFEKRINSTDPKYAGYVKL